MLYIYKWVITWGSQSQSLGGWGVRHLSEFIALTLWALATKFLFEICFNISSKIELWGVYKQTGSKLWSPLTCTGHHGLRVYLPGIRPYILPVSLCPSRYTHLKEKACAIYRDLYLSQIKRFKVPVSRSRFFWIISALKKRTFERCKLTEVDYQCLGRWPAMLARQRAWQQRWGQVFGQFVLLWYGQVVYDSSTGRVPRAPF
jgi:hypothetical protein